MNTLRTYSLMFLGLPIMLFCSKGAMPGMYRMAENSMVPSTLKCTWPRGSRNSAKVCLKNSLYCSSVTWAKKGVMVRGGGG